MRSGEEETIASDRFIGILLRFGFTLLVVWFGLMLSMTATRSGPYINPGLVQVLFLCLIGLTLTIWVLAMSQLSRRRREK
jgi:hypothetical protein